MKAQQEGEADADSRQQHSNGVRDIQCSSVSCVCLALPWHAMVKAWRSTKARRAHTVLSSGPSSSFAAARETPSAARAAAWLAETPRALNASSRLAARSRGTAGKDDKRSGE